MLSIYEKKDRRECFFYWDCFSLMKKINFSFAFLFLAASTCLAQKSDWLHTDKKEFEKMLPLFSNKEDSSSKKYNNYPLFQDMTDDTLSIGSWVGNYYGIDHSIYPFTLTITQTSPFLEGTFKMIFQGNHDQREILGSVRGKNSMNQILLIIKYNDYNQAFDFLEGKSYNVVQDNHEQVFAGIGEEAHKKNPSKVFFILYKQ
jgi:hypothetical protein